MLSSFNPNQVVFDNGVKIRVTKVFKKGLFPIQGVEAKKDTFLVDSIRDYTKKVAVLE